MALPREVDIKNNIIKNTVFMAAVSVVMIICIIFVYCISMKTQETSHISHINAVVSEYQVRFNEKIETDINNLSIIKEMIEQGYMSKEDIINNIFDSLPKYTKFEDIEYYEKQIINNSSNVNNKNLQKHFNELTKIEKQTIKKALEGEKIVSKVYFKNNSNKLCYALPILENYEITGVLTAVRNIKNMSKIVNFETSYGISLNMAWVDEKGKMIKLSDNDLFNGKRQNIVYKAWEKNKEFEKISNTIYSKKVRFENRTYTVYKAELGMNDWSLVYIDSKGELTSPVYALVWFLMIIFITLIMFWFITILYTFRHMKNDKYTILRLSDYDHLTQVYNTDEFINKIKNIEINNKRYGVFILNFRRFQYINSAFGRNKADKILVEAAKIIKRNINDDELVCRYKSDEFCILLCVKNKDEAYKRISKIMDEICRISEKFKNKYIIKVYCGVALDKKPYTLPILDMLNKAECAIKTIKHRYDNDIAFFNSDNSDMIEENLFHGMIESNMENAIDNDEFKLYLQPKKDLKTDKIVAAEALVRWIKPDGNVIYPDKFVPLFEANGFCVSLDLYMFEKVCNLLGNWFEQGKNAIPISINQSKLLFCEDDYIDMLCAITEKYNVDKKYIVLEILEGLVAENVAELNEKVCILREKGFQVAMDDFGSGYSSLNTFTSIDVDEIKLDKIFLRSIGTKTGKKQKRMMESIISIAKSFGMRTVVEGVETIEHEKFLKNIGCDYGQGYLYGKPVRWEDFEREYIK